MYKHNRNKLGHQNQGFHNSKLHAFFMPNSEKSLINVKGRHVHNLKAISHQQQETHPLTIYRETVTRGDNQGWHTTPRGN